MKTVSLIAQFLNTTHTTLYNYYYLASQNWCSTDYKIHGLWGDISASEYPSYCTNVAFDLVELQTSARYNELLDKWFDCTYDETINLYQHEWDKHGTCITLQTRMTQNEYFEKTLDLFVENNNGDEPVCFDLDFELIPCSTFGKGGAKSNF
jgi:ribonuclease I